MILALTPFAEDKNLGGAYNAAMELLPDNAWAIMQDHDAMPTTPHWFRQFREAIDFLPHAGAFVAMANRIGPAWQRCGPAGDDVREHRRFGAERVNVRTLLDVTDTKGWGGVMFAISKAAWREAGGFADGFMGCTDHSLHFRLQRIGRRSFVHQGIYTYHVRASSEGNPGGMTYVPDCPCRGVELTPTQQVHLP